MEAVVFCGMQASGKTTFYAQHFLHTHARISMDLLRTRHREARFLAACLETQMRFVVDNTNPTREERARYVQPALAARYRVLAYVFETDVGAALARNAARTGRQRIPDRGVLGTRKRLQVPTLEEGFASVHRVVLGPGGFGAPERLV